MLWAIVDDFTMSDEERIVESHADFKLPAQESRRAEMLNTMKQMPPAPFLKAF